MASAVREGALLALIDFLSGDSVDDIAIRYRLTRDHTEQYIRGQLLAYGFGGSESSPAPPSCT